MKYLLIIIIPVVFLNACQENAYKLQYEHENTLFVEPGEISDLEIQQDVYVPAYSDIYYETENNKTYLTVILSLRNISYTDTVYFDKIEYYGSSGNLIRKYIDKPLMLRPMESMEYIVNAADKEGGTGANFVVGYRAKSDLLNHPFIETIMMGNLDNYRFSFSSKGVPIKKK